MTYYWRVEAIDPSGIIPMETGAVFIVLALQPTRDSANATGYSFQRKHGMTEQIIGSHSIPVHRSKFWHSTGWIGLDSG